MQYIFNCGVVFSLLLYLDHFHFNGGVDIVQGESKVDWVICIHHREAHRYIVP